MFKLVIPFNIRVQKCVVVSFIYSYIRRTLGHTKNVNIFDGTKRFCQI
jgi:hypothetical protein